MSLNSTVFCAEKPFFLSEDGDASVMQGKVSLRGAEPDGQKRFSTDYTRKNLNVNGSRRRRNEYIGGDMRV